MSKYMAEQVLADACAVRGIGYPLIADELETFAALLREREAAHPDDAAVDAFAATMKGKLAEARTKGRGGWTDKDDCPQQRLCDMLRAHVEKGDPRDVANFCMFLHQRGESILPKEREAEKCGVTDVVRQTLEWYANEPEVWVSFAEGEYEKQFNAATISPYLRRIPDDRRGHPQFVPNGLKAAEALQAWDDAVAAAPKPVAEG